MVEGLTAGMTVAAAAGVVEIVILEGGHLTAVVSAQEVLVLLRGFAGP